jgi:methylated-DNA-[protein]-cysteine S-methyltransferase
MASHAYALFETSLGRCGIGWGARGVAALQLPEDCDGSTRRRILCRLPGAREAAPPAEIAQAVCSVLSLLAGERRDLLEIELDMQGVPEFHQRVYAAARRILPGSTLTYGELARRIDQPGAARAVGQALGRNPFAIIVPCHRVLAAGGKLGGFSADGGTSTKLRLLTLEGASLQVRELFARRVAEAQENFPFASRDGAHRARGAGFSGR